MRKWIDLFEKHAPAAASTIVYHGGAGEVSQPRTPFFTTTHYDMAKSYAVEKCRGREACRVTAFDLSHSANIAKVADLERIAAKVGAEWDGLHPSDLLYDEDYREVVRALEAEGYDAVFMYDFGYHDDFSEEPTYIILNTNVLSSPRVVEEL